MAGSPSADCPQYRCQKEVFMLVCPKFERADREV